MDRFHLMSVFAAVAETGSFAGGARRLGLSPPAVTRAIASLEAHLGLKLFTRTTRQVRTTEAGRRYLEHVASILAEVEEADAAAAGVNAAPRGQLAVTAPVLFGRQFVVPGIVEYLKRYPDVAVTALFVDRVVNLIEEGQDVAVRIGELPDSTMQAVAVGYVRRVVCAAPAYLKAHGTPRTPADLASHSMIFASPVTSVLEWRFEKDRTITRVRLAPRLTVTANDSALEAALQGLGITRLLSYQVGQHLQSGALKTVLTGFESPRIPVHVVHREGRQGAAKVRAFVDLMAARLRADKVLR
jgi:DNA-binding transcriptional LysR family regulator